MSDPASLTWRGSSDYVLDASVAIKWFVPEIHSVEALRFLDECCQHHVPGFFAVEFANAIWKKVGQRRQLAEDEGRLILEQLQFLPIKVHHEPMENAAFELILAMGNPKLALYDFVYLALAEAIDCPLLTADRVLYDALAGSPFASRLVWVAEQF